MLFHFEIRGPERWEVLGSGQADDEDDTLEKAIEDLRSLHGGKLPVGTYRYIAARGRDARWEEFLLGPDGKPLPSPA